MGTHPPPWVARSKSQARPLTATLGYRGHFSEEWWPGVSHMGKPTIVILCVSCKGHQSPVCCCVEATLSKDTEKLDTDTNSIFTFHRHSLKIITMLYEEGRNHRQKLCENQNTLTSVVASTREESRVHGQPDLSFLLWLIFTASDHSMRGGGRCFTGRRGFFQVKNSIIWVKNAKKGFSLCGWAAKGVFITNITESCQVISLQGSRDITVASAACPTGYWV